MLFFDFETDCLEEMCFSESYAAVNEEWVVGVSRVFSNRDRGSVCHVIIWSDDKLIEPIIGVDRE